MNPQEGAIIVSSAAIALAVVIGVVATVWTAIYFATGREHMFPPAMLRDDVLTPVPASNNQGGVHAVPALTG
jgi:hypothetical protein